MDHWKILVYTKIKEKAQKTIRKIHAFTKVEGKNLKKR